MIRPTQSPTDGDSREPDLSATEDGRVILSWVEKLGEKRYALRTAMLDQKGWSEAQTVSQGENWFVNWADFPSVIALKNGALAAHWLVKSGSSTYAYDVNISQAKDGGKSWNKSIVPHRDNTQTEHGFVSLIPLPDGRLGAVWLDGRNMKDMKETDELAPAPQSMTLRYAAIDAGGNLTDETQLDERVCECCGTSVAVTSQGPIAVYRDRSQNEVRDIYVVRQVNGRWTTPQALFADNWQINGCPVNGPSVAADGTRVAIAWFTSAANTPRVKIVFSQDAVLVSSGDFSDLGDFRRPPSLLRFLEPRKVYSKDSDASFDHGDEGLGRGPETNRRYDRSESLAMNFVGSHICGFRHKVKLAHQWNQ